MFIFLKSSILTGTFSWLGIAQQVEVNHCMTANAEFEIYPQHSVFMRFSSGSENLRAMDSPDRYYRPPSKHAHSVCNNDVYTRTEAPTDSSTVTLPLLYSTQPQPFRFSSGQPSGVALPPTCCLVMRSFQHHTQPIPAPTTRIGRQWLAHLCSLRP